MSKPRKSTAPPKPNAKPHHPIVVEVPGFPADVAATCHKLATAISDNAAACRALAERLRTAASITVRDCSFDVTHGCAIEFKNMDTATPVTVRDSHIHSHGGWEAG